VRSSENSFANTEESAAKKPEMMANGINDMFYYMERP
jgi:hypothetical protein